MNMLRHGFVKPQELTVIPRILSIDGTKYAVVRLTFGKLLVKLSDCGENIFVNDDGKAEIEFINSRLIQTTHGIMDNQTARAAMRSDDPSKYKIELDEILRGSVLKLENGLKNGTIKFGDIVNENH